MSDPDTRTTTGEPTQRSPPNANFLVPTLIRHRILLLVQLKRVANVDSVSVEREAVEAIHHVDDLVRRERRAREALEQLVLLEPVAANLAPGRYRAEVERIARAGLADDDSGPNERPDRDPSSQRAGVAGKGL